MKECGSIKSFDDFASTAEIVPPKRLFVSPPTTKEYEERNYFDVTSSDVNATKCLFTENEYWLDYIKYLNTNENEQKDKQQSFLSTNFLYPTSTFTEIIFSLSICSLPFQNSIQKYQIQNHEKQLILQAKTSIIVLTKETKENEVVTSTVNVVQKYFDPLEPTQEIVSIDMNICTCMISV
jgi:hypothetical protein